MSKISIVREHSWEMAHRLPDHPGACRFIHGHSYKIQITISSGPGSLNEQGMVMDFGDVKRVLTSWLDDNWDHRLMLYQADPLLRQPNFIDNMAAIGIGHGITLVPFIPTAENMAWHLGQVVFPACLLTEQAALPEFVTVTGIRLWETEKNYAEWRLR